jgi:hypothetical protein
VGGEIVQVRAELDKAKSLLWILMYSADAIGLFMNKIIILLLALMHLDILWLSTHVCRFLL